MNEEQIAEAITALLASAFTHQKKMIADPMAGPPTPNESKVAYLTDPIIQALTDATLIGVYEVLSYAKSITRH